jgi:anti-sigma regulatory factor (Ser/Thr protein kinase)
MLMVDARARLREYLRACPDAPPDTVLKELNRVIYEESGAEEFITLYLCSIDTRTGLLLYASAGHEPPLLWRGGSGTREWVQLPSTGLPLGMVDNSTYGRGALMLNVGDVLVVATDGATEAENANGVMFGADGIKTALSQMHDSGCADAPLQALMDVLVQRTLTHRGVDGFIDDVTYLMIKVENLVLRKETSPPPIRGARVYSSTFRSIDTEKEAQVNAVGDVLSTRVPADQNASVFMAVEEALSNAVFHGNRGNPDKRVSVEVWADQTAVSIVVSDEGPGFELHSVRAYEDESAWLMESGRGLIMIVSLMDEVIYWNGGSSICMVKRIDAKPNG